MSSETNHRTVIHPSVYPAALCARLNQRDDSRERMKLSLFLPLSLYRCIFPPMTASSLRLSLPQFLQHFPQTKKKVPTNQPSKFPTAVASKLPSQLPSSKPSRFPTAAPSDIPSMLPSSQPSKVPTNQPSKFPTAVPSKLPN